MTFMRRSGAVGLSVGVVAVAIGLSVVAGGHRAYAGAGAEPSVRTAPNGTPGMLPRVKGGLIYPLLPGGVAYNAPVSNLYASFGHPPKKSRLCGGFGSGIVCDWKLGYDQVNWEPFPNIDGRSNDNLLIRDVVFESDPRHVRQSRLKSFRTPEGLHVGSTRREVMSAFELTGKVDHHGQLIDFLDPTHHLSPCGSGVPITTVGAVGMLTRPYTVTVGGRPTRQQYCVTVNWQDTGSKAHRCPISDQFASYCNDKVVSWIRAELESQEAWCDVGLSVSEKTVRIITTCYGPLI